MSLYMKFFTIVLVILFSGCTVIYAQNQKFIKRSYTTEDGLLSNTITHLFIDSNNFLWLGSQGVGISRFDGANFKNFYSDPRDSLSLSSPSINEIDEDSYGNIWVVTNTGGVSRFDPKKETFKRYMQTPRDSTKISSNQVSDLHIDNKGTIWISHIDGLDRYDPDLDAFVKVISRPRSAFNSISEDNNGNLWLLASNTNLICYSTQKSEVITDKSIGYELSFKNGRLRAIIDDDNVMWSTYNKKVLARIDLNQDTLKKNIFFENYNRVSYLLNKKKGQNPIIYKDSKLFEYDTQAKNEIKESDFFFELENDNNVFAIQKVEGDSYWLGTAKGLIYLENTQERFRQETSIAAKGDAILAMFEDNNGSFWVSTAKQGLFNYDSDTDKKDDVSYIFKNLNLKKNDVEITEITQDRNGVLWFASQKGIFSWDPKKEQSKLFFPSYKKTQDKYSDLFISSDDKLYAGIEVALLKVLNLNNQESNDYQFFMDTSRDSLIMPAVYVNKIIESDANDIWLGTEYFGLSKLEKSTNNFVQIPLVLLVNGHEIKMQLVIQDIIKLEEGLFWIATDKGLFKLNSSTNALTFFNNEANPAFNFTYSLVDDHNNNIWLSTDNGISCFEPSSNTFTNWSENDGLGSISFKRKTALKSKNGRIYFGGNNGIVSFDPSDMKPNTIIPPIVLTNIKKFTKGEGFEEVKGANNIDELILEYNERDFSVGYAALNHNNAKKSEYAYMLEGYNEDWVYVANQREVTFTNLDPGQYTFKVKGSNNNGVWNEEGKTIPVKILKPWWTTNLAYLGYSLLCFMAIYTVYVAIKRKAETKRLLELDGLKSDMYTQISHEFRTPLTIITGLNEELKSHFNGQKQKTFDIINRNSKSLLHLVDQLLELKKMEAGKMVPDYINANIVPYLKYLMESFESYAHTKKIGLHFITSDNEVKMDHDPEKLLVIVSNLLSNAIKFTPTSGNIYFQIDTKGGKVLELKVKDTGIGIDREVLPNIFERFYMTRDTDSKDIPGIGVGLALTKELVELLNGTIAATSEPGTGSTFTIALPITQHASRADQGLDPETIIKRVQRYWEQAPEVINPFNEERNLSSGRQSILIVEDNNDVLTYLRSILGGQWDINTAQDGESAIAMAIEQVPDIVLCDLMIPIKNGFEVLQTLKEDKRTSHIPVMILSAMADDSSRMKGFEMGADAYLVKPFKKQELQLRLGKLVETREQLQQSYRKSDQQYSNKLRKTDREFLGKIEELVLGKEHNTGYNIQMLCTDMGMSRTQLHNKLKALTGLSTSIFVRVIRLRRAEQLLLTTQESVSEIAYRVGFNDPSYFTRCFTEEFGVPPKNKRQDT